MTIKHLGGIFGRNPTFNDVTIDGGIYIGGNTSSNFLDDYQEGTYTPTLTPVTSGTITLNTSNDILSYTKIGRNVHVFGQVFIASVSSPVGATVRMSLPFAIPTGQEGSSIAAGTTVFLDASSSYAASLVGMTGIKSTSLVAIYKDASTISAADALTIDFTYFTS